MKKEKKDFNKLKNCNKKKMKSGESEEREEFKTLRVKIKILI